MSVSRTNQSTAPLSPILTATGRQPAVTQNTLSATRTLPDTPLICPAKSETVSTGEYAAADVEANLCTFSTASAATGKSSASLLQAGLADFNALSSEDQTTLNQVATQLGFPNARNLTHALRHIPPERLQAWQAALPAASGSEADFSAARSQLDHLSQELLRDFFGNYTGSRQLEEIVRFSAQGDSQWSAQGYLAVFNSFTSMAQRLPSSEMQRLIDRSGSQPLEFARYPRPPVHESADLLKMLSQSMLIASTDKLNTIRLADAALSLDSRDIIDRSPALQNYTEQINRKPPSEAHVISLKNMLNISRPPERQLPLNGEMDAKAWSALQEFEAQQYLTRALDILQDDKNLPPATRQSLSARIAREQQSVFKDGVSAQWQDRVKQLVTDLNQERNKLSPESQSRLQALEQRFSTTMPPDQFRREQLDLLVNNWFGIIDGGEQVDFTEQVITHEMGHILHDLSLGGSQQKLVDDWAQISFRDFDTQAKPTEMMAPTLRPGFDQGFVSSYAQLDPEEDFAESFRLFVQDPERLRTSNPLKYMFLAGATGSYRGKEHELVEALRAAGHSDKTLQDATLTLRGQKADSFTQTVSEYGEMAGKILDNTILGKAVMSGLRVFGLSDAMHNKMVSAVHNWQKNDGPSFDVSVASLLPGLERQLGIPPIRAVHPSQPSYVHDELSRWVTEALGPNVPDRARNEAKGRLQRFATDGVSAFERGVQNQIPPQVRAQLEQPAERATLMAMAYLRATPDVMEQFFDVSPALRNGRASAASNGRAEQQNPAPSQAEEHRQRLVNCDAFTQGLRQFMGDELFAQLPSNILTQISNPQRRQALTGNFGQTRINGAMQDQTVRRSAEALDAAVGEIKERMRSMFGNAKAYVSQAGNQNLNEKRIEIQLENIFRLLQDQGMLKADAADTQTLFQRLTQGLKALSESGAEAASQPSALSDEEIQAMIIRELSQQLRAPGDLMS